MAHSIRVTIGVAGIGKRPGRDREGRKRRKEDCDETEKEDPE